MSTDKEQIYTIMTRYLQGHITDEESVILENWKSEEAKNRLEFDDLVELWRQTGTFHFPVKIDTDRALSEVHNESGIRQAPTVRLSLAWQIAAILILSVLFSGLYTWFFSGGSAKSVYYEEVQAAYGTRTSIELPDGSSVFLNSGSSLRFSSQLAGQKERRVELKGEGYFKVAKDAKRPFIVDMERLSVEALGTAFNVNAYEPDSHIEVLLTEGKVAVRAGTEKKSANEMILEPNQLAHYDVGANNLLKETVTEPAKYISWTEGKMIFIDDPIQEVIKRMENWYNVDIRLKDKQLMNYRFTGTFVNESLEEVLNILSLTSPLNFEVIPATKNGNGEYLKRTIILKSR
jgi:ferric-dicitrate binding protein FerR (iron transport regulator)